MSLEELIKENETFFEVNLHGKKLYFRRWKVKDKKEFLLQATNDNNIKNFQLALKLLKSLIKDKKFKLETLPKEDIFYILTEIKKQSDGNEIEVITTCPNCGAENEVIIDLNNDVDYKPMDYKPITLNDKYQFNIKPVDMLTQLKLEEKYKDETAKYNYYFLIECINSIVFEDKIYNNFSKKELEDFIDNLDFQDFEKLYTELSEKLGYCIITTSSVCEVCKKENNLLISDPFVFLTL
jgi:hypothetical protein